MQKQFGSALAAVVYMAAMGCGSGGGTATATKTATVSGQVRSPSSGALPTTLSARVEGSAVTGSVQPDGSFTLLGVPLGSQTIEIVNSADASGAILSSEGVDVTGGTVYIPELPTPTTYIMSSSAGISGAVYEGPVSPVSRPGQSNQKAYAGAVIEIVSLASGAPSSGGTTYTTTSDVNGDFTITLPAGQYRLTPESGSGGYPRASPITVTVQPNTITDVEIDYDTGIL